VCCALLLASCSWTLLERCCRLVRRFTREIRIRTDLKKPTSSTRTVNAGPHIYCLLGPYLALSLLSLLAPVNRGPESYIYLTSRCAVILCITVCTDPHSHLAQYSSPPATILSPIAPDANLANAPLSSCILSVPIKRNVCWLVGY
jgi:hypothetical protein